MTEEPERLVRFPGSTPASVHADCERTLAELRPARHTLVLDTRVRAPSGASGDALMARVGCGAWPHTVQLILRYRPAGGAASLRVMGPPEVAGGGAIDQAALLEGARTHPGGWRLGSDAAPAGGAPTAPPAAPIATPAAASAKAPDLDTFGARLVVRTTAGRYKLVMPLVVETLAAVEGRARAALAEALAAHEHAEAFSGELVIALKDTLGPAREVEPALWALRDRLAAELASRRTAGGDRVRLSLQYGLMARPGAGARPRSRWAGLAILVALALGLAVPLCLSGRRSEPSLALPPSVEQAVVAHQRLAPQLEDMASVQVDDTVEAVSGRRVVRVSARGGSFDSALGAALTRALTRLEGLAAGSPIVIELVLEARHDTPENVAAGREALPMYEAPLRERFGDVRLHLRFAPR